MGLLAGLARPCSGYDERVLRARALACRPYHGSGLATCGNTRGTDKGQELGDVHVQHPHNGTDERWWPSCASSAQAAGSSSRGSGMRSSVQRQRASERERTLLREDWLLCRGGAWDLILKFDSQV
mgnify:CR=1 FL=1